MELVIYPPIFTIWKWNWELKPALKKQAQLESEFVKARISALIAALLCTAQRVIGSWQLVT